MADEGTYDVEPEQPDATAPPASSSMGSAGPSKPGSVAPNARLNASGLLDDFDEDADFSDPGAPAASAGRARPARAEPAAGWPPIVTDASLVPVLGSVRALGVIGGVMLVLAVVTTAIATSSGRPLIPPLIALYEGVVHTGTGVVAVLIAARFAERRVNRVELIACRMLVLVAVFLAIKNSSIPIPMRVEEHLLAAGAYYLGVMILFRLPRFETGLIAGAHFCLWVLMMIGSIMYQVDTAAPAALPSAAGG